MDDLEDELDLRFHKGLNPEVYYRCPTSESLEGALRNELDKNAASFIPTDVVTEFIFATSSTITVPVTQQPNLDALIQPADHLQSVAVEYALCRDIDGRDRLKVQRAIARSIVQAIQDTDGFKYSERSALNREGGDGARFKYVCQDSFQNRDRKNNTKKDKSHDSDDAESEVKRQGPVTLPTYDCGGAIHIKFSLKRDAVNVVYKHNPIHTTREADDSLPTLITDNNVAATADTTQEKQPRKRKRSKKDETEAQSNSRDPHLDMSTSPEGPKSSTKKKSNRGGAVASSTTPRKASNKKTKAQSSAPSTKSRENAPVIEESTPPIHVRGKACIRCREKKIKCNESKPTCNQCRRGLWTCQYDVITSKKRSKNGCLNCKQRRRKCTEERPSCAHCLRLDDDCEYADYS